MSESQLIDAPRSHGATALARGLKALTAGQKLILLALLASVTMRVVVALYLGDVAAAPPMLVDQVSYHALGMRLVEGHGFSFAVGWYPFTPPDTPTAHWSYLYSLFVAAIYVLFGPSVLAARIVQAVLAGILLPYVAYCLAQRLFPERPRLALWTLLLTICYAYFILYAATLMTESLYIACLLWSMVVALDVEDSVRAGRPVSRRAPWELGLSLGLATLLRQAALPWAAMLFLYLFWRVSVNAQMWKGASIQTFIRAVAPLLIAGMVIIAFVLPFTVRNLIVYDSFLLLNSNTGFAMFSAQHPMHGVQFKEFTAAPIPQDLLNLGLNEAQLDRILLRRGIQFILDDPVRYLLLSLSRVGDYFSLLPGAQTTLLHAVGRFLAFGAYVPLWLYGLFVALRSRSLRSRLGMPLLFMVFYALMHILTWAMVRYRLPADAVAMPLAALAVDDVWRRLPWAKRTADDGP